MDVIQSIFVIKLAIYEDLFQQNKYLYHNINYIRKFIFIIKKRMTLDKKIKRTILY